MTGIDAGRADSAAPRPRFWSIQILRIVAAYGVVVSHFLMSANGGRSVMNGVDIFFLISGFLVWAISDRVSPTPLQFMVHRTARIIPLYWAVIAVQAALLLAVPRLSPGADTSASHILLSALFLPHTNATGAIWPFVTQGWTLNLDIFYYVVFAASLALPRRWRLPTVTAALVTLTVIGAVIRPWHNGVVTWTYTNPLAVAFVAGLWIAELWLLGRLKSRRWGLAAVATGLLIYAVQTAAGTPYASFNIYVWVAASCCVMVGLLCIEGGGVNLDVPAIRTLADWTYAIYLCHQLVRMAAEAYLPPIGWVQMLALVAGSTLAGKLGYELVELPANRWFRRLEKRYGPKPNRVARAPISATAKFEDVAP